MKARTHYFAIQTGQGYEGRYDTPADAKHARRRLFGIRALAHPIVRVIVHEFGGTQR